MFNINIGVVGGGYAGAHYIELLSMFDVNVLLYDPFLTKKQIERLGASKVTFEELLTLSDVISIHAPSIPETKHMFNAETLKLMKNNAILINTARGSLIDERVLYNHMKAGKLKYACIDVTDPEPPIADHPLKSLHNVIFSPHLAGLTHNGLLRIGTHSVQEIERFINNDLLTSEVTREQLIKMA